MGVYVVVLIVLNIAAVSLGCSCFPTHLQYKFCRSDFVVHILPIEELRPRPPVKTYRVFVIEVLKDMSGRVEKWSIKSLVTPSDDAACGISLTLFKRYIVGGSFVASGDFRVRECSNINDLWTSFSECELALMYGEFGNDSYKRRNKGYDCSCQIKSCEGVCEPPIKDECVWNNASNRNETANCQRHHRGHKSCQWEGCYRQT